MNTCCPSCQTIFRITPEQLRVRAGKVRCGNCRAVFNAIDRLLDDDASRMAPTPVTAAAAPQEIASESDAAREMLTEHRLANVDSAQDDGEAATERGSDELAIASPAVQALPAGAEHGTGENGGGAAHADEDARDHGRWLEEKGGVQATRADRSVVRPFAIVAALLALTLVAQVVFHFRVAIGVVLPAVGPALAAMSAALGSDMPLPRRADLLSIEASDLQTDPAANKLLVLQATLRNRASYAQAYPALELTLTDTNDKPIVRRVIQPDEYLPVAALDEESFAAGAEVEIRLWLEAKGVPAAGYRLYVFYP
ncbi:MAG TPA: DUF3426 domain-containing protein [Accumulibacter sp.]|uniref:DUF3426 domain-containing protein n=1 Tax=Accumulibacter sp. TaxID=2053492 RepID=UPI0025F4F917|nr:DUF3426 domain-containing protein [Accumulibacter sp.]MCM8598106.1 zinc-ribbon domain-containing protein [Accumulibacter sp.]MCM8662307.1 zinc-ribbon domain-containing protein [Accumulibacter sp.]HNC52480.1 DUF3426 domain-containing protein [Accumulibacter sp.]HNN47008.1 DUF3426 domain-containing protein [Azospira sp.]